MTYCFLEECSRKSVNFFDADFDIWPASNLGVKKYAGRLQGPIHLVPTIWPDKV